MDRSTITIPSPLGHLQITAGDEGICSVHYASKEAASLPQLQIGEDQAYRPHHAQYLQGCVTQLHEYFASRREAFDLPLHPEGTAFQQHVWQELQKIGFGFVKSYTAFARDCGDVLGVRAVASANGKNPIAIIIPCHRVVGSDGALRGYNGGLARKQWLLRHEGVMAL